MPAIRTVPRRNRTLGESSLRDKIGSQDGARDIVEAIHAQPANQTRQRIGNLPRVEFHPDYAGG